MTSMRLFIPGVPAPQGSKAVYNGRVVEMSKKVRPWRRAVAQAVRAQRADGFPIAEAVTVTCNFYLPRPKSHYRADGVTLRPNAPGYHVTTPDVDKLVRGLLDALTIAGVLADDKYVVTSVGNKDYADGAQQPGAYVEIRALGPKDPWSSAHIPNGEL